uniref:Uncharacterized protein n=1 Tax=Arundo donax TaxID=35708 RepID=A0A0A9HAX8_ARUDO
MLYPILHKYNTTQHKFSLCSSRSQSSVKEEQSLRPITKRT